MPLGRPPGPRRFVGRVVLITGASEGVGAEAARRFAEEGAALALVARRHGPLRGLAAELEGRGARVVALPADVRSIEECRRAVDSTVRELGGLSVLVNNAGVHYRGPFESRTTEEIASMVDVNVRGPMVLTHLALPHLVERKGVVVNVASLAGKAPVPGAAAYSATKFALRVFSLALRAELAGRGVKVALVSPGPIRTGSLVSSLDEAADVVLAQPMSTPFEVAGQIVNAAVDGRAERGIPRVSAALAGLAYFAPGLGRALEPVVRARGRRMRARYEAECGKRANGSRPERR